MFGIGTGEILLILVIAMLVVGPERMVEFAGKAGRFIARFRAQSDSITREFRDALGVDAVKQDVQETVDALKGVQQDLASAGDAAASLTAPAKSTAAYLGSVDLAQPSSAPKPPTGAVAPSGAIPPAVPAPSSQPAQREPTAESISVAAEPVHASGMAKDMSPDAEAIDLDTALLVPEDEDAEAITLEEPAVIADDSSEPGGPESPQSTSQAHVSGED